MKQVLAKLSLLLIIICTFANAADASPAHLLIAAHNGAWVFQNVTFTQDDNTGSNKIVSIKISEPQGKVPQVESSLTYASDGTSNVTKLSWDAPPSIIRPGQPLHIRFMIAGNKVNNTDHTMGVGGSIWLTADAEGSGGGASIGGFSHEINVSRYSSGSFPVQSKYIDATISAGKPGDTKVLNVRTQGPGGSTVFNYAYAWKEDVPATSSETTSSTDSSKSSIDSSTTPTGSSTSTTGSSDSIIDKSWWKISTYPERAAAGFWVFYGNRKVDGYSNLNDNKPAWQGQWRPESGGYVVTMTYLGSTAEFQVKFNGNSCDGFPYQSGKPGSRNRIGSRIK